jgi:hypothetical protein
LTGSPARQKTTNDARSVPGLEATIDDDDDDDDDERVEQRTMVLVGCHSSSLMLMKLMLVSLPLA